MHDDPGETTNLHRQHPQRVREMISILDGMVASGRSTPGPVQANDVEVDVWKLKTMPALDPQALDDYR
jgi:hypothetical protein